MKNNIHTACKERTSAPMGFMSSLSSMPVGMSSPYSTKMGMCQRVHDEGILKHPLPPQRWSQYKFKFIMSKGKEHLSPNFSFLIFSPILPPKQTVWRVTLYCKICLNTLRDHFGRVKKLGILFHEFVESISSGSCESIAPVAQAS